MCLKGAYIAAWLNCLYLTHTLGFFPPAVKWNFPAYILAGTRMEDKENKPFSPIN